LPVNGLICKHNIDIYVNLIIKSTILVDSPKQFINIYIKIGRYLAQITAIEFLAGGSQPEGVGQAGRKASWV
jgi:hypothetical protein